MLRRQRLFRAPQAFREIRHQYNEIAEGIERFAQANIPTIHGNRF